MKDTLRLSADKMRLQAIIITTLCLLAASAMPAVEYYFTFQYAGMTLGPFAWAHWIVVGVACTLGVLAHGLENHVLLAMHVVLCAMLGAALGGFDTAFWYQLSTRCALRQSAFAGCAQCTCADTNTCTADSFATDPTCTACTAYPAEVCTPAMELNNKFILAFMGLTALIFLAIPAFYSLLVLCRLESSNAAAAAKRQLVSFTVEQQTGLVEAGEKPTVTPPMLASWVGFLLDCGEQDCITIGENCRSALAGRGFELPVQRKASPAAQKRKGRGKRGGKHEIVADATGDAQPALGPEAYVVAESGGSRAARGAQIAAEEQRRVQFMTGRNV